MGAILVTVTVSCICCAIAVNHDTILQDREHKKNFEPLCSQSSELIGISPHHNELSKTDEDR